MIKRLQIKQYRKLKDINLDFSSAVNVISGANGTCKSSLLHIISNSFQAINSKDPRLNESGCVSVIKAVNAILNPKVESLTRGDQKYNDPAHGINGVLFTADYYGHNSLAFRRHNSNVSCRYAIKPMYQRGTKDSLPSCPVIYLGISRLVPFGEYQNDDAVSKIKKTLPEQYWGNVTATYRKFTHYGISGLSGQQMGDIKTRTEFSSDIEGIDSNTISAGEDNLLILLTALESLRYYHDCLNEHTEVESLLLIDELDATLHPAFQIKLLRLFREYASQYKIQIIFTSHSMSILEDMLESKDNVLYFVDNLDSVTLMEEPDIYKIKMHLSNQTHADIYFDKCIPVFTEDAEARFLLKMLLDHYEEKKQEFRGCSRFFYMPDVNFGGDNLQQMFEDSKLLRMTMRSICVLDGDKKPDKSNCIISLPGKNSMQTGSGNLSPENLLFQYAKILYDQDDPFWTDRTIIDRGYGKVFYLERIYGPQEPYIKYRTALREAESKGDSIDTDELKKLKPAKKEREFNKDLFNKEKEFFSLLFKHWLNNSANRAEIYRFYKELHELFVKMARYNDINPNEWRIGG